MPTFSRMSNAELAAWIDNFTTVVGVSPANFGFTAGEITDFATANGNFKTDTTKRIQADDAASAAVKTEQMSRETQEARASFFSQTLKLNADVPDDDKIHAGVEPNKSPTYTAPVAPAGLIVNGYENGENILKWERNGNKTGTQFVIEYRAADETEFEMLDVTTKTTYTHDGMKPGMQCAYRIKAKRAGESSPYSNIAVVYMT